MILAKSQKWYGKMSNFREILEQKLKETEPKYCKVFLNGKWKDVLAKEIIVKAEDYPPSYSTNLTLTFGGETK